MSISIYYTAIRGRPMTVAEHQAVHETVKRYAVDDQIVERERTGDGPNWESFCIYDPATAIVPDVIFEGATKLPDNSDEACWVGLQRWCNVLSDIRRILPDAVWCVHVDDHVITWDETRQGFDPSA